MIGRRILDIEHIKSVSKRDMITNHTLSPETIEICLAFLTQARDNPKLYWYRHSAEADEMIRLAIKELTVPEE
jgi:hypothetical protein